MLVGLSKACLQQPIVPPTCRAKVSCAVSFGYKSPKKKPTESALPYGRRYTKITVRGSQSSNRMTVFAQ